DMARRTRKAKKESFERVMGKGKVETYGDVFDLFCGLSRRAIEVAAIARIQTLVRLGYSPARIIGIMEVKRRKQHDGNG
ncbi:MAG: hypothetical protein LBF77_09795, partial [Spirochaetaceae bacterium]|nr:hypothetical protein [Spirochaetaceae bacterium]